LKNRNAKGLLAKAALAVVALVFTSGVSVAAPTVIDLTHDQCQFLEAENGIDHVFKSTRKADWDTINKKSGAERLAKSKVLKLKAGVYIFRVTN
jgi:hypothetical protein